MFYFIYCTPEGSFKEIQLEDHEDFDIRTASHNAYNAIRTTVYLNPLVISLRYTLQLALQAKIKLCNDQSYFNPCMAQIQSFVPLSNPAVFSIFIRRFIIATLMWYIKGHIKPIQSLLL